MRFQQYSVHHNLSVLPALAAVSLIAAVMVLTIMSSEVMADSECEVVAGDMTFFTGGTVFELEDGDILFTTDLVRINTVNGDAVHSFTILGGTGKFEGAMGQQIILSAIVDSDAGTFDGAYDGVLCIPDDDD